MLRRAVLDTFKVIHSPVSAMKKRFLKRFGKKRRRVFRLEWDTLLPDTGRFPVNSQTLDMVLISDFGISGFGKRLLIRNPKPETRNCSDSERTRTSNLLIRSQVLYPIEPRSHFERSTQLLFIEKKSVPVLVFSSIRCLGNLFFRKRLQK
jgi:hypothetical protein